MDRPPQGEIDLEQHRAVHQRIREALARDTARWSWTRRPRVLHLRVTPLELALAIAVAIATGPFLLAVAAALAAG